MKTFSFKTAFIIGIILLATLYLLPTFVDTWPWPKKKINLGLDLQGGMHLVLEVQNNEAVVAEIDRTIEEMKKDLRDSKYRIVHRGVSRLNNNSITIKIGNSEKKKFENMISKEYANMIMPPPKTDGETFIYNISLPDTEVAAIKKMATEQALETIRNRIDQFGVMEPDIRIQGGNRILMQLPGIKDPDRAKKLIGKTAQLTFQLVVKQLDANDDITTTPPVGAELLFEERFDQRSGKIFKTPYWIKKRVLLDGSRLTDARVEFDQNQFPIVGIAFDRKGSKIFERVTGDNAGKRLAIVLDKKVHSAPSINEKIAGGRAVITGRFNLDSANDLAIALRAGSLPAPVKIIEERTVGSTLGQDSIRTGLVSMAVGGILVIIFMAIYYKGSGLIANLALMINIVLIGGGLAFFEGTLTLPGIAGVILTIGMAVDANVIIFERIREEYRSGKTPLASVHDGFERATLTILDANVTTFIAAIVLYQFGTGPVKGFAVTLCLGIVASLFTALVLSKAIFNLILKNRQSSTLSI